VNSIKISYNPAIDGLRAIAVLSVIFFHLKIDFFRGGYLGVDIFFVISGYLISSLIYKELETKKTFSFTQFYERRARRILPALLFVIIFCLPIAWFYIFPYYFKDYLLSLLTSIFFSSNFYFYLTRVVYAAEDSILKPFLHTWSLGIEEQFYIFFPIFFIFLLKFFKKSSMWLVLIIIVLNILFSDWMSKNYFQINHYMILTRGWELMAGVLICLIQRRYNLNLNPISNNSLSFLGLILIFFSIFFFNETTRHPSIITTIPILGSMFIILFAKDYTMTNKILSLKPLVWIGLISYSLYLWHHPIIAFKLISHQENNYFFNNYFLIIIIFSLSIFSYFFIEKPFRNNQLISKKLFFLILAFLVISLTSFVSFAFYKEGLPTRFPKILKYIDERPYDISKEDFKICFQRKKNFCGTSSINDRKDSIFLVGDSQVASLSHILEEKLKKTNYNLINLTFGNSCYYSVGYGSDSFCTQDAQQKRRIEIYKKPNSIVILGYTSSFMSDKQKKFSLLSIKDLLDKNYKVVLIYPYMTYKDDISDVLKKEYFNNRNFFTENSDFTLSNEFSIFNKNYLETFNALDNIQNKNLFRVYQHKLFCDNYIKDKCVFNNKHNIFTVDRSHPSSYAGNLIVEKILEKLELN
jgi:peptidoglycan/LPS O-acetylase OafA/YrhL